MRIHAHDTITVVGWRCNECPLRSAFPKHATGSSRLRGAGNALRRPIRQTDCDRRNSKLQRIHERFCDRRIIGHHDLLSLASGPPSSSMRYTASRPPHIWTVPPRREMEFIPSPFTYFFGPSPLVIRIWLISVLSPTANQAFSCVSCAGVSTPSASLNSCSVAVSTALLYWRASSTHFH